MIALCLLDGTRLPVDDKRLGLVDPLFTGFLMRNASALILQCPDSIRLKTRPHRGGYGSVADMLAYYKADGRTDVPVACIGTCYQYLLFYQWDAAYLPVMAILIKRAIYPAYMDLDYLLFVTVQISCFNYYL